MNNQENFTRFENCQIDNLDLFGGARSIITEDIVAM